MTWMILEMLGALAIGVFIVWWTMFSGRPGGARREEAEAAQPSSEPDNARAAGDEEQRKD